MFMKKIYTSSYDNAKKMSENMHLISISGNKGKSVDFSGDSLTILAPKLAFWKEWHENYYNKKPLDESVAFYIEHYYADVLKNLNPENLFNPLKNNDVLLCYEKSGDFCHRYIVGEWLNLYGYNVHEINENLQIVSYPKYVKQNLQKLIKPNENISVK